MIVAVRASSYAWMLGVVAALCLSDQARGSDASLDPAGRWYCLVYGHLSFDDWHITLLLDPEGPSYAAWGLGIGNRGWRALSNWSVGRGFLSFEDPGSGRRFEADLSRSTLGGTWAADARRGGWWCARRDELAGDSAGLRVSVAALAAPLVAQVVKAPDYPRQAVREAKEGRAVVCFLVDRNGVVVEPEVVELTDEVFRDTTLRALAQSRFAASDEPVPPRPGCRSYLYRLDAVR